MDRRTSLTAILTDQPRILAMPAPVPVPILDRQVDLLFNILLGCASLTGYEELQLVETFQPPSRPVLCLGASNLGASKWTRAAKPATDLGIARSPSLPAVALCTVARYAADGCPWVNDPMGE